MASCARRLGKGQGGEPVVQVEGGSYIRLGYAAFISSFVTTNLYKEVGVSQLRDFGGLSGLSRCGNSVRGHR